MFTECKIKDKTPLKIKIIKTAPKRIVESTDEKSCPKKGAVCRIELVCPSFEF